MNNNYPPENLYWNNFKFAVAAFWSVIFYGLKALAEGGANLFLRLGVLGVIGILFAACTLYVVGDLAVFTARDQLRMYGIRLALSDRAGALLFTAVACMLFFLLVNYLERHPMLTGCLVISSAIAAIVFLLFSL